jgi:hypothetical protein
MAKKKLKIWLSATSILEEDLRFIKNVLLKRYTVIYSNELIENAGTDFSLENHLKELDQCDLFLGIIKPKLKPLKFAQSDIYLKEFEHTLSHDIPYWYLVHRDVTFTRNLLKDLGLKNEGIQSKNKYFFDIRTIDIYQEILQQSNLDIGFHQPFEFFRLNQLLTEFQNSIYKEKKRDIKKMMLASTVYGFEDQLSKIIEDLQQNEFKVLNSHYGSIQVNPQLSNLNNCIQAVHDTNWFAGLVRPYYGTGNINEKNITFEEIKTVIQLQKPRWFYIHRDVIFASKIMSFIEVKNSVSKDGEKNTFSVSNILKKNKHIDIETIELYNSVTKDKEENLELRNGNWAQEFFSFTEAQIYIETQFSDYSFIDNLLNKEKNGR